MDAQYLIRSLGYGLYSVEAVGELELELSLEGAASAASAFGIEVVGKEVVGSTAYLAGQCGLEPCGLELRQARDAMSDISRCSDPVLSGRLRLLADFMARSGP